jgi:hypothetical protein
MTKDDIAGGVIGIAVLFGFASIAAIVGLQIYDFLLYGSWRWLNVAELLVKAGYDPTAFVDPSASWDWVGVGKIVKWTFYSAPAALIAILVSVVFGWLAFVFVDSFD